MLLFVIINDQYIEAATLAPAHRAPVGLHGVEELLPGAGGALEAVAVQGELVDELVQGRVGLRDAPGVGDDEDLPVLELFDVVYRRFEAGAVVEEGPGGPEVLVEGDQLVTLLAGVGLDARPLLLPRGEHALEVGPYVGCRARHEHRMIAWGHSGMIKRGK